MTTLQEHKLEEIKNHKIKYRDKELVVLDFKEVKPYLIVYTEKRAFNFLPHEIDIFLDEVEMVNKNFLPEAPGKYTLDIYEPTAAQKKVQQSLETMLDKVLEDPKNIPQAKAVCDIANTMVNMERTQIQLLNLAKKHNR